MTVVIVFWLTIKILLHVSRDHAYWYLLAVLTISLSKLFRASTVSSPTDLLIIILAFSVGVRRTYQQWIKTLWIVSSIGVISIFTVNIFQGSDALNFLSIQSLDWLLPNVRIMLGEIHFNLSGYLLGPIGLIGYGLCRHCKGQIRWMAFAFGMSAYVMAFLTGSRASAFLPIVSIVSAELAWKCRKFIQKKEIFIALSCIGLGLVFCLMVYLPNGPLSNISANEYVRSKAAQCFFNETTDSWARFLRGGGGDLVSDFCEDQVDMMNRAGLSLDGLATHAHNSYLQIFADYGIFPALFLLVVFAISLRNSLIMISSGKGLLGTISLSLGLFFFLFGLIDSTLIYISLSQVLTGYLLSMSWSNRLSADSDLMRPTSY